MSGTAKNRAIWSVGVTALVVLVGIGVWFAVREREPKNDLERLQAQTHPVSTLWDPADPRGQ